MIFTKTLFKQLALIKTMGRDKKKPVWRKSYIQIVTEKKGSKENEFISCEYCGSLMLFTSIKCPHCGATRKKLEHTRDKT